MQSRTPYSASEGLARGVRVVRLRGPDGSRVSIATGLGNNAYEFSLNGKNAIWFPYDSLEDYLCDASPKFCGTPFLAPWANRLDEHAFHAGGERFELDQGLGNYLTDSFGQPIHGLLSACPHWKVDHFAGGLESAEVAARLEFGDHPDLMAQFPFEHRIEITHRLRRRRLEVQTSIFNTGNRAMPLSVGFHPYFQLHDCDRDEWSLRLAASSVWNLNDRFTPTGGRTSAREVFPNPAALPLRGQSLDHVFGDLQTGSDGLARFSVTGRHERVEVAYGPGYPVAVVYAPAGQEEGFVCFEPMSGITNAFNLAHRGKYGDLPSVRPGGSWTARFWVEVSEF